ncbi:MAG: cation:proton antiporter [Nitrososphaeria archaeon]
MTIPPALLAVFALSAMLLLGKLGEEALSRLRMVPFVGAIVMGLLLGPGVLGALAPNPYIEEFVDLGIVFILFMAGAEEVRPGALRDPRGIVSGISIFAASLIAIYAIISRWLSMWGTAGITIAIAVSMVSAGPLSRTLQEVRAGSATERARVFVEALAMEVSAVLAFSMLSVRSGGILESALILASVVLGILAFGRFGLGRILSAAEGHLRTMEVVFSILVGFVLLLGFLAQTVGFNSAMAAFFLGVFASDYLRRNVYLLEKMRAITYGFFEPMFFFGLGLYFVRVDYGIAILGLGLFALAMSIKFVLGSQMARLIRVGGLRNFFAIAHEGGVDGAIMLTALQLGLVGGAAYSSAMLAILLMAIIAPLGYGGRSALARHRPTPSLEFVRYELEGVTAEELSRTLPTVYAREGDSVRDALSSAQELDARVMVLVDDSMRVRGFVNVHDLFRAAASGWMDSSVSEAMSASGSQVHPVPTVGRAESASRALEIFRSSDAQVVAVVDADGRLVGTILERELLRYLFRGRSF